MSFALSSLVWERELMKCWKIILRWKNLNILFHKVHKFEGNKFDHDKEYNVNDVIMLIDKMSEVWPTSLAVRRIGLWMLTPWSCFQKWEAWSNLWTTKKEKKKNTDYFHLQASGFWWGCSFPLYIAIDSWSLTKFTNTSRQSWKIPWILPLVLADRFSVCSYIQTTLTMHI